METTFTHITARCQCKQVTFMGAMPPFLELVCHCVDCQRFTEQSFAKLSFFKIKDTQVIGELTQETQQSSTGNTVTRQRCKQCGTAMFDQSTGFPDIKGVVSETLEPPHQFHSRYHIWVSQKIEGLTIEDDCKKFDKNLIL